MPVVWLCPLPWLQIHWWAVMLICSGLIVVMAVFIKVCAVHTPSSNPRKSKARKLTMTLRRSHNRHRSHDAQTAALTSHQHRSGRSGGGGGSRGQGSSQGSEVELSRSGGGGQGQKPNSGASASTGAGASGSSGGAAAVIVEKFRVSCSALSLSLCLLGFFALPGHPHGAQLHVVGMLRFMSDVNQPNLPTPFHSVLVSDSVFKALSAAFDSINSPDNSPLSHSVLVVLFLPYWSFQLYTSLWRSPSALI